MSAPVSIRVFRSAVAAVRRLAVVLAVVVPGARGAAAQFLEFRPPPPAQAGASVPVTVAFGGPVGANGGCNVREDYYGCPDPYYYTYDDAPPPSTFSFAVNGEDRTGAFTYSGPTDTDCWYGDYNSYQCTRTYTAAATVPLLSQNNVLTAAAAGLSQTAYVAGGSVTIAVVSPRLYRDPASCVLECGDLVQSFSTPAYVSRDVARSLTFVYRSGTARPRPVIEVDVSDASSNVAYVGLQIQRASGAVVPLVGGGDRLYRRYQAGVPNRLAVQIDPTAYVNTGAPAPTDYAELYTAVVTTYDANKTPAGADAAAPVRVLVDWIHGPRSLWGAGWGLAGAPEFRWVTPDKGPGGALALFDPSGEMGYYEYAGQSGGTYSYASPPGDFSAVSFNAATNLLTRRWPDGRAVQLSAATGMTTAVADRLGNQTRFVQEPSPSGPVVLRSVLDPTGAGYRFTWRGFDPTAADQGPPAFRLGTPFYVDEQLPAGPGRRLYFGVDTANDLHNTFGPDPVDGFRNTYEGAPQASNHLLRRSVDKRGGATDYLYHVWGTLAGADGPAAASADGTAKRASVRQWAWPNQVLEEQGYTGFGTFAQPARALPSADPRALLRDATGSLYAWHLDAWGAADLSEAPGGVRASAQRDALGRVTRTVDARGNAATFVWNGTTPFLLDSTYDAGSKVGTAYTYDAANSYLPQQTRVGGQETEYRTYNGGRLAIVRNGGATGPATGYDYAGQAPSDPRPSKVTDPRGHATAYTYDLVGLQNAVGATDASGPRTVYRDGFGRDSVTVDPLGHRAVQTYDVLNRPVTATDPNGNATRTDYDALFARAVTDAAGQVYRDSVNALGLPVFRWDPNPNHAATATTYDAAGRVASVTNHRQQVVSFGYDATLGYLNARTTAAPADSASVNAYYGTDPRGRVRWASNAESVDSVFTDTLGRDTLAVHRIPALAGYRYLIRSTYDSLGRRTRARYERYQDGTPYVVGANSNDTWYGYGAAGELASIGGAQLSYNNEFAPTSIQYPSSYFSVTRGYTAQHTLAAQHFSVADNVLAAHFTYDSLNRVTGRYSPDMTLRRSYAYDRAGQLAARWRAGALTVNQTCRPVTSPGAVPGDSGATYACTGAYDSTNTVAYAWDALGNPGPSTGTSVFANSGNQLQFTPSEWFEYDLDGNLYDRYSRASNQVTKAYRWNSLGQLVGVGPSFQVPPTVTFGYDGWGRRVRKSATADGATRTTYFVWDGDDLAADVDAGGGTVAMYAYYPGGADQPFSVQLASEGKPHYYVTEPPGHVTALVDFTGAPLATYQYEDPFGADVSTGGPGTGAWTNRLRFGAREYDEETGLYYQRARYYDPQLGRFISPDPIGLAGGVNWYAYAGNDPVNYRDPSGLCTDDEATKITYTQDDDGNWSESRTCPTGGGGGLAPIDVVGLGKNFNPTSLIPGYTGGCGGLCGSQADAVVSQFAGMVPAINTAAVNFLPTTASIALGFVGNVPVGLSTAEYGGITFKSAHAARHLVEAGSQLAAADVEAAIAANINGLGPNVVGSHWGWLEVSGQWLQYRAYLLPTGIINVGTYVLVQGPLQRR